MKLRNMDGTCLGPPLGLYSNEGLLKADGAESGGSPHSLSGEA